MANMKLEDFKAEYKGKKAAVIGVGISNRPLIKWLYSFGVDITAFDALGEEDPSIIKAKEEMKDAGVELKWSLGRDYLRKLTEEDFDIVFKTPKMRYETEELSLAKKRGAVLTSEMELFMNLCPSKIIAVTGSDGKTTTTTIISEIVKKAGKRVFLGGNIGTPLLDQVGNMNEDDVAVLELSSFQLLGMRKSSDIAVITNITPNHLDFHKDYQEYIDSKKNIFLYQGPSGRVVLNSACDLTYDMRNEARGKVCLFALDKDDTLRDPDEEKLTRAYVKDGMLCYEDKNGVVPIISEKDIFIPGSHNVQNFLAAALATYGIATANDIACVAREFKGVPHRIEFIREIDGARYYNSSIDTSPNRTINTMKALASRGEKGVLIAGGADKKCIYDGLGDAILSVCDRIILYGSNAGFIKGILAKESRGREYKVFEIESVDGDVYEFENTRENVVDAYKEALYIARQNAKPGEIVIMSNVGTSYDHFRHFEHRGDMFRDLVLGM